MKQLDTIVLVDDSESDNFYHQMVIEEAGVAKSVITFQYAEEALAFLKEMDQQPPDLIFLDINMPRMNGFQFIEEYSKLDEKQKARMVVILLTTSLNPADRQKAEEYPDISAFLNKPLNKDKLDEFMQIFFNSDKT